jgi:hypothetical protein
VKGNIGLGQIGNGFYGKPSCSIGKSIHTRNDIRK